MSHYVSALPIRRLLSSLPVSFTTTSINVRRSPANMWCADQLLYSRVRIPFSAALTLLHCPSFAHASITVNTALVSKPRVVDQEDCTFFCLLPTCSHFRRAFGHVNCRLITGSLLGGRGVKRSQITGLWTVY